MDRTTSTLNATRQALRTRGYRGGTMTFKLGSVPGQADSGVEVPATLGERLVAAMKWQRDTCCSRSAENSTRRGKVGI